MPHRPGDRGLLTSFAEVTLTRLIADSSSLSSTEKCSQMPPKCLSLREADPNHLWYVDGEASCRPLLSHGLVAAWPAHPDPTVSLFGFLNVSEPQSLHPSNRNQDSSWAQADRPGEASCTVPGTGGQSSDVLLLPVA